MAKKLFQTNIKALDKVRTQLKNRQTMSYIQVILNDSNDNHVREAITAIDLALISLNKIL